MIHSLAGGKLANITYADFAKVRIIEGEAKGEVYWYITNISMLKSGDKVYVPLREKKVKGEVERIDRNVSSQMSPVPLKRAKSIISKAN